MTYSIISFAIAFGIVELATAFIVKPIAFRLFPPLRNAEIAELKRRLAELEGRAS